MNSQVNIYMPLPKPNLDSYTAKINNITPTKTAGLPTTAKTSVIGNTISNVKGELKDKVCGAIDLVSDIKSGLSSLASDIKDVDVNAYINSGVDAIKGKVNEVKNLFKSTSEELQKGAASIKDGIKNSLEALEDEIVEQVESAKLAAAGLKDTVKDIGSMGNKLVKNLTTLPDIKGNFCEEKTEEAAAGVEEAAEVAAPVAKVVEQHQVTFTKAEALAGPMTDEELGDYFGGEAIIPVRYQVPGLYLPDYFDYDFTQSVGDAVIEFKEFESEEGYPVVGENTTYFDLKGFLLYTARVRTQGVEVSEKGINAFAKREFEEQFPGQKYI